MQDRCVLILSCDKYADLWKPCFQQFWKYWHHCPYPVYLGSNTISYTGDKRVKTILSGNDIDWSTSLISILKQIPEEHIFIWFDDVFLTSPVDNKVMEGCFSFLEKKTVQHIHYRPIPYPDSLVLNGKFGRYEKGAPYRVTTVGFWKKESLLEYLLPGENPWNFEIFGSYRSSYDEGFYCPTKYLFRYIHVVEKGKLYPDAVSYCKKNRIPLDTEKRDIIVSNNKLKSDIQALYFNAVLKIPWKWRVKIMWMLRKLLISY